MLSSSVQKTYLQRVVLSDYALDENREQALVCMRASAGRFLWVYSNNKRKKITESV